MDILNAINNINDMPLDVQKRLCMLGSNVIKLITDPSDELKEYINTIHKNI